jgi:HAD superfamily phosphatase
MSREIIVFDMDGVLVDVTASYRETIQQTVEHFAKKRPSRETIQDWKNRGGWNDDWRLSWALIEDAGVDVPFATVVEYFQKIFHGNGRDGLIMREEWIAGDGLFERLSQRYAFAVFTGRLCWEAEVTLKRFANGVRFAPIVGCDTVPNHKPSPDGLFHISKLTPGNRMVYVGDTVDDARAAHAAHVPFIGVSAPGRPHTEHLTKLLMDQGAVAVVDDINQLERVLPQ